MGVLKKLGILFAGCIIIVLWLIWYGQTNHYDTETVVFSLFDHYEVQSVQMGSEDDPIISVDVYDEKDLGKVTHYLKSNLSRADLNQYELNIFLHEPFPQHMQ